MDRLSLMMGRLEELKAERRLLLRRMDEVEKQLSESEREVERLGKALAVVREVVQQTEAQISGRIERIVNLALKSIFPESYRFNLRLLSRRGKTEAEINLTRDGFELHPLQAVGGGVVDILSVALRIALWSLSKPRTRKTIILDEPFRHLSADLLPLASRMLKEISRELGIQFIVVTHSKELVHEADRVFRVEKKSGVSIITEEEG